jgi:diguanylate cyclase
LTEESRGIVRASSKTRPNAARELELLDAAGTRLSVEVLTRPFQYDGEHVTLAAIRDLTERKEAEAEIRRIAFHDGLTDLPNRYLLDDRLAQALELGERTISRIAVLCLDLDRFKFVNDLLGHDAGDCLLVQVSNRLREAVRSIDTVARLGGDEFVVVQVLAELQQAPIALAQRLVEGLSAPYDIHGQQVEIGVSIGIAVYPDDGRTAPTLLKNGDTALYRAKLDGRGQYRCFEPAMDLQLRDRRSLEQDLRHAFQQHELELNYQPLYHSSNRELEGFEALLGWTHPTRGVIKPSAFIPIAEECGLIVPIGNWVLETACAEAASWPKPWSVAVTLSSTQLRGPDLPEVAAAVLARTGWSPGRLELEVTESVLTTNPEEALDVLTRLRGQGIRLSLDDLGSGYSSLSYLRRFPFNKLKIDKSFLLDCETKPEAAAIVGAIVTLGHSLNLCVTAERVETEEQLALLRGYHCH